MILSPAKNDFLTVKCPEILILSGPNAEVLGIIRLQNHLAGSIAPAGTAGHTFTIVVANDGSLAWSPAEGFALSYHWLDAARETVIGSFSVST